MQGQRTDTPARATNGRVTVTCDEVLDLSAVESLRAQLLAALGRGGDLEIQAAAVRQIDRQFTVAVRGSARGARARSQRALHRAEPAAGAGGAAPRLDRRAGARC